MSHEFITKLLEGSRKLDQMRADLNLSFEILFGLIQTDRNWISRFRFHEGGEYFSHEGGYWQLTFDGLRLHTRLVRTADTSKGNFVIFYNTRPDWISGYRYSEWPEYAWERLPMFVDQLKELFPHLESAAARLIKAAG